MRKDYQVTWEAASSLRLSPRLLRTAAYLVHALVLGSILGCGGDGDAQAQGGAFKESSSFTKTASTDPRLEQIREIMQPKSAVANSPVVLLDAFERSEPASAKEGALQIGSARDVDATRQPQDFHSRLSWQVGVDGKQTASISFESPAAQGLRLGLQILMLPMRSVLRVSGSQEEPAVEIDSSVPAQTVQNNLNAGVPEKDARRYWLPTMRGARTTLEIELPADMPRSALVVSVPQLVHLWTLPEQAEQELDLTKAVAASCHRDATCSPDFDATARSVARMIYVEGAGAYYCTGTLMADWNDTGTPYFMTAAHCISTQAAASTLETAWFYRSASCGSTSVDSKARYVRGGAALLYASAATDTSFLRLSSAPPAGVVFAGWDANTARPPTPVTGIHHPRGGLQKISTGTLNSFFNCTQVSLGLSCTASPASTAKFLQVRWTNGATEPGSSGSPLFSETNGNRYVIGQLSSGSVNTCGATRNSQYGRFDLAYQAALKQWLGPSSTTPTENLTSVFRFFNPRTGAHFYTNSVLERDFVISTYPVFNYEGPKFKAFSQAGPGLAPVYRFFNVQTGAHFYSISPAERDFVLETYPQFQYEGPTWYAQPQAGNGADQMYRFFHLKNGVHFYTLIKAEADFVRATYPDWQYEGGVYYAWPN
ncbi:MAG: trypsin-like peptidase domain-containing protein [Comamonadaceae bacterium]|nr:trypsin-like peptidase domain-containing protein [Comamonadaceae bacterium]